MSNPTNTPDPLRPAPDLHLAPASTDSTDAADSAAATAREVSTADSAAATAPTPSAAAFVWEQPEASAHHRPRYATILWGVLLLGFGVFMVAWTLFPGTLDPTLWLLAAVIGVGLVLVIAGIAAATRRPD
jgi:peptidoglycan/LPS O-acetylase OafA/YrhL